MTATEPDLLRPEVSPQARLHFPIRLLVYLVVWLSAATVFEVFLHPAQGVGPTDTQLHQRVGIFCLTPLLTFMGLIRALSPMSDVGTFYLVALFFPIHALLALLCSRRRWFAFLIMLQVFAIATGVVSFLRLAPNAQHLTTRSSERLMAVASSLQSTSCVAMSRR